MLFCYLGSKVFIFCTQLVVGDCQCCLGYRTNTNKGGKLLANGEVFIPSAFTPNGDKLNDYFFVLAGESVVRVTSFRVYNRWGQLVCSKQNILPNIPHLGWDGKLKGYPAPVGVYVYYISVELANRTRKEFKGTVAVIR